MNVITPMLSKTGEKNDLVQKDFLYEPKLDGVRVVIYKEKGKLRLINRRKRDVTDKYPELQLPEQFDAEDCVIDGEIIVYDTKGNPDFHLLMRRDQLSNTLSIEKMQHELPATYVAFDIYRLNGKSLKDMPLSKRKELLDQTVKENESIQKMHYTPNGLALWDFVMDRNLEGVVAKRLDSSYQPGKRTNDWLKIKNFKTQDCIIVGYSQDQRLVSSLALAAYYKGDLRFSGKVGTGFSDALVKELHDLFQPLRIEEPPLEVPAHYKNINWIKPAIACEVKYIEFGSDGMLRSPSFLRLRPDKPLEQCIIELPEHLARREKSKEPVAHWRHRAWNISKEKQNGHRKAQ